MDNLDLIPIPERAYNFRVFCQEHPTEVESANGDDLATNFGISKTSIIVISKEFNLNIQKKKRGRKLGFKVPYKPRTLNIIPTELKTPVPIISKTSISTDSSAVKCSIDVLIDKEGIALIKQLLKPFQNKIIKLTIEPK